MRILFTGGGTGGHFYPIISIAEEFNNLVKEHKLVGTELYFMSPAPYDEGLLFEHGIQYKKNSAGKLRTHPSFLSIFRNFFDLFKTAWGILVSILQVYHLYPDVVFGKGGYASFPALLAARILGIPVVIHESDSYPGRVNRWAGKFATRVALAWREAAQYFPQDKIAYTGLPVRKDISNPITSGAREFLQIEEGIPVILVLGGSQGAEIINDNIVGALPQLVEKYAVIHQVGKNHFEEIKGTKEAVLHENPHKERYKPFDYLNALALRMAAGVATVVVSRAGSTIFEISSWGVPAILIPISKSNGDHQRTNAFSYARSGAGVVIEEGNLTPNILASEITRLVDNPTEREKMREAAKSFYKPDAARLVAEEILKIGLSHEIR